MSGWGSDAYIARTPTDWGFESRPQDQCQPPTSRNDDWGTGARYNEVYLHLKLLNTLTPILDPTPSNPEEGEWTWKNRIERTSAGRSLLDMLRAETGTSSIFPLSPLFLYH